MMGNGDIQPWPGERNRRVLLSLGKLAEECSELAGICARIIEQGINECEPVTKVPNREALAKEMADVVATLQFARIQTQTTIDDTRITRKVDGYYRWFAMLPDIDMTPSDVEKAYSEALAVTNDLGYAFTSVPDVLRAMAAEIDQLRGDAAQLEMAANRP
jgi:hypothetical protein